MTTIQSELDAKEFIIALAFGSQIRAISFLRRNPALVNTATMADAIIPQTPLNPLSTESFDMALQIRQLLGECFTNGMISKKKFWQAVNARSPRHGETMATLLIKLMISEAQFIAQNMSTGRKKPLYMKQLHRVRKILNSLIQNDSPMKIDVNIPNAQGQYPLQLLDMAIKTRNVFQLLSKDYEHIKELTTPSIRKRLQRNMPPKGHISTLDISKLPKIKAKLTNAYSSNKCTISVLNLAHPTFLRSTEKSSLSVIPIYPKDIYLITTFSSQHIEISPLRKMYDTQFSVNHNGKWIQLSYESIYPMYQRLTKGEKNPFSGIDGR